MEDIVDSTHGGLEGGFVAHVADVELDLVGYFGHLGLILVTHVVLLFLVAREDADLCDVGSQESVKYCVAEGTCSSCDHEGLACKN